MNIEEILKILKNPKKYLLGLFVLLLLFVGGTWLHTIISEKTKQSLGKPTPTEGLQANQSGTGNNNTQLSTSGDHSPITSIKEQNNYSITERKDLYLEHRPRLTFILEPGSRGHLKMSPKGYLYLEPFAKHGDTDYLYLPFLLKNEGKTTAKKIEIKYYGPVETHGTSIDTPDKSDDLQPGDISDAHAPWINVTGIALKDKFETTIKVLYTNESEHDSSIYWLQNDFFFERRGNFFVLKNTRRTTGKDKPDV